MKKIIYGLFLVGALGFLGLAEGDDVMRMQGIIQPTEVFAKNNLICIAMMLPALVDMTTDFLSRK